MHTCSQQLSSTCRERYQRTRKWFCNRHERRITAELVLQHRLWGIAQGAFEAANKYAHERQAFGKPIAHHQMISAYLADMATQIDAARLLVYKASFVKQEHYENNGPRHTKEASMAKLFAGDTAMWVSERAIQVLGGYGYTKEFPVERFFRDAKITQIYEGTQEVQRIVINRAIKP